MTIGRVVRVTTLFCGLFLITTAAITQEVPIEEASVEQEDELIVDEQSVNTVSDNHNGPPKPSAFGPLTVITSEQIEMSGVTNIEELLTQFPMFTLQGKKTSHPTGNGVVTADLRNLGPGRTLVLLNGHRIVGNAGPSVDLSIIPVAAIDRVEVLGAGASAMYGQDAVAGVVDIILKQDFNGFDAHVLGGISAQGDGEKIGASTTFGFSADRGNFMLSLGWIRRNPVYQRDRAWANPPCENVSWNTDMGIQSICGSYTSPGGNGVHISPQDIAGFAGTWGMSTEFIFQGPNADWHPMQPYYEVWQQQTADGQINTPYDAYNWGEQQVLSGQSDRFQAVANGQFNFTDSVSAYVDGLFAYQRHGGRMAGEPVRYTNSGSLMLPLSSPFIPEQFWDEVIEPFGVNEEIAYLQMGKRTNDVGARVTENTSTTFRVVAGLKGEITKDFSWDVFGSYSRNQSIGTITNLIDVDKFETALDPDLCLATPGCVLANMFGEGTMQAEVRDFLGYDATETTTWDLINAGAIFSMALFELPGGSFTTIIGGDLQWRHGQSVPGNTTPDYIAENSPGAFLGKYNSQEAYVQVIAPFVSDVFAVDLLELNLAGRMSHFNPFGTEFSFGAGLLYAPIQDITFRGSLNTSFKAPNLNQLYGGSYSSNEQLNDPCAWIYNGSDPYIVSQCQTAGVPDNFMQYSYYLPVQYGSNPNLQSETSRHVNFGTVFEPTFMPDSLPLRLTLDWYKYWVFGSIQNLSASDVVRNCYTVEGLDDYCDFITRDEATGAITMIEATMKNIGDLEYAGFDLSFNMGFPLYKSISGNLGFNWSVVREFTEVNPDDLTGGVDPAYASYDHIGNIYATGSGVPKYRLLSSLAIGDRMWTVENRLRYISGMEIDGTMIDGVATGPFTDVDAVAYWDISARVRIFDFNVVLGVQNVLDRAPPYFPGTGYNGNPQVYDFIGRYFFANLGYEFQ